MTMMSALFDAVERGDLALVRLLIERGATKDEDIYQACGQSNTALLDLLYEPGGRYIWQLRAAVH